MFDILIKYLGLDPGKTPNLCPEEGSGFLAACSTHNFEISGHLAERFPEFTAGSCFSIACLEGSNTVIHKLIEEQPKYKYSVDRYENNCLHLASREGHLDTVVFLSDKLEMDPATRGYMGKNAFLFACKYNHLDIVEFLLARDPTIINSVDNKNRNGMMLALKPDFDQSDHRFKFLESESRSYSDSQLYVHDRNSRRQLSRYLYEVIRNLYEDS